MTVPLPRMRASGALVSEAEDEAGAPPPHAKAKLLACSAAGLTPGDSSELP